MAALVEIAIPTAEPMVEIASLGLLLHWAVAEVELLQTKLLVLEMERTVVQVEAVQVKTMQAPQERHYNRHRHPEDSETMVEQIQEISRFEAQEVEGPAELGEKEMMQPLLVAEVLDVLAALVAHRSHVRAVAGEVLVTRQDRL